MPSHVMQCRLMSSPEDVLYHYVKPTVKGSQTSIQVQAWLYGVYSYLLPSTTDEKTLVQYVSAGADAIELFYWRLRLERPHLGTPLRRLLLESLGRDPDLCWLVAVISDAIDVGLKDVALFGAFEGVARHVVGTHD